MRLIEKLKKGSTIELFFVTILIIPFQTALLFPFTIDFLSVLQEKPMTLFHNNPMLLIGFILLPIIYCIITSLLFQPKRLVSPLNIQIGTFVIFTFMFIYRYLDVPSTSLVLSFEDLFLNLTVIAIVIFEIGMVQFFIVWWVIGLNYDSSDRLSFIINSPPKEITKILGKKFLKTNNFTQERKYEKTNNPTLILKCRDTFRNSIIMAFGSLQGNEDKCILATVAYHKGTSWISKSEIATERRNSIINDVKARLQQSNPNITIYPLDKVDDIVSVTTFSYIESMTNSKIEILAGFFHRITLFFKIAIFITVVMFIVLTTACYMQYLDTNTYVGVITPIIIALIIEFGVPLREELSIKKTDDFYWK